VGGAAAGTPAPLSTYLLGLCLLFRGRHRAARRLIDRAYELRHWLDDRVCSPRAIEVLEEACRRCPDWDWPAYQLGRERWRAVGLDVRSAIEHLADDGDRPVRFVQVGANDGRSGDPLRELIAAGRLQGVLVEPQPEPFERLRKRLDDVDGLRFVRAAITEQDGPVTLYTDPERSTLGTLEPDRNLIRDRRRRAVELSVEGLTFASLTDRHDIDGFELLQLDTEGFDYKILRQVPLDEHGVQVVNLEYYCLPVAERRAAGELLERAGFALLYGEADLLAVRRDRFEEKFCVTDITEQS
jgi:FkbM family methyltransferase